MVFQTKLFAGCQNRIHLCQVHGVGELAVQGAGLLVGFVPVVYGAGEQAVVGLGLVDVFVVEIMDFLHQKITLPNLVFFLVFFSDFHAAVYIVEGRVIIAQMGIQTGESDEAMAPGLFLFQGFVNVQGLLLVTDGVVELEFCVFFAVGDKFIDFAQFGYDQGAVNVGGYTYRLNAGEERTTRDNEVRLENLTPETAYTFEVMANTASEEYLSSAWSKVEFSTAAYVPGFQIVVDETRTTAYSVEFDIVPDLKGKTYYYDLYSTARWNETTLAEIQAEIDASMHMFADMMDMTYEEVIEMMLSSGDQLDIYSGAGFRGNTEFCVFAFYWDVEDGMSSEASVVYFTTPEPKTSSERVDLFFDPVEPYNMTLTCEPSSGVQEYYLIFDTTERVEEILATMEDEEAILSYGAMNYGVKLSDRQVLEQQGLRPETSYTALVMAIDKQGNRYGNAE